MSDDDLPGWTFDVRERSAGVYEGLAKHESGPSVSAVDTEPDRLLDRLRRDARELLGS